MKYKLVELYPRVFVLSFTSRYELCMAFLRACEGTDNKFYKKKHFSIFDFMSWYVENNTKRNPKSRMKNVFSFPNDTVGFNLNGYQIKDVFTKTITDWNKYDSLMLKVYEKIKDRYGLDFDLIGVVEEDSSTLRHEIAHSLYSRNKDYKKEMNKLINNLPKSVLKIMKKWLLFNLYSVSMHRDEIQAYLSTGLTPSQRKAFLKRNISIKTIRSKFRTVFNQYFNTKDLT